MPNLINVGGTRGVAPVGFQQQQRRRMPLPPPPALNSDALIGGGARRAMPAPGAPRAMPSDQAIGGGTRSAGPAPIPATPAAPAAPRGPLMPTALQDRVRSQNAAPPMSPVQRAQESITRQQLGGPGSVYSRSGQGPSFPSDRYIDGAPPQQTAAQWNAANAYKPIIPTDFEGRMSGPVGNAGPATGVRPTFGAATPGFFGGTPLRADQAGGVPGLPPPPGVGGPYAANAVGIGGGSVADYVGGRQDVGKPRLPGMDQARPQPRPDLRPLPGRPPLKAW